MKELSHILKIVYNKTITTDTTEVSNSILNLAGILSGAKRLYGRQEGGTTIMCNAINEIIEEETSKAKLEQLIELVQDGLLSLENGAKKANLSEEAFQFALNKKQKEIKLKHK